jgi:hypothetical protein
MMSCHVSCEIDEGDEDDGGDISFHGGNGVPDDPYGEVGELKPCPHCGRNFTPVNLTRHISKKICQKKRKIFDMKNKRLDGELKQALVQAGLNNKPSASAKKAAADKAEKKGKWRADRERLQEAIRAGKQISKAVAEGNDQFSSTSHSPTTQHSCQWIGMEWNELYE